MWLFYIKFGHIKNGLLVWVWHVKDPWNYMIVFNKNKRMSHIPGFCPSPSNLVISGSNLVSYNLVRSLLAYNLIKSKHQRR